MATPKREWIEGATYHITNRGNHQENIFREIIDYSVYLSILINTLKFYKEYNYKIISYCLMTNHVHILLKTGSKNPSYFMRRINSMYAKYFNEKYELVGHLFQGRYYTNLITNITELIEVSRYIHLNPVKAKIVESPEEYIWSSYNKFILSDEYLESKISFNKIKIDLDLCLAEEEILGLFDIYTIVSESNKEILINKARKIIEDSKSKYKRFVEEKIE